MASRTDWSVELSRGQWFPLHIHLHWLTFAALLAAGVWRTGFPGWGWYTLFLGVLLLTTLIHEWGHAWAASQWALTPLPRWILWPLGGLERPRHAGRAEQVVSLALSGPMTNLLVAFCLGLLLEVTGLSAGWPHEAVVPVLQLSGLEVLWLLARLLFWTNLALALVNLLPAKDLDGGWLLQQYLALRVGPEKADSVVQHTTALSGLGLCVAAVLLPASWEFLVPAMLGLGLIVFVGGLPPTGAGSSEATPQQETSLWQMAALDDSGYPLESSEQEQQLTESASWWEDHWEELAAEEAEADGELESRVDEILARLHDQGMQSLSAEDIAVLNRASRKYRRRMEKKRKWSASAD